jgi:CRP/FNR family cyclic AMP-dependent transcriptional regulator
MSLVDGLGRSATVVTRERSVLLWIDRACFWESLERMPALMYNLVRILSRRLRLASAQIQWLATQDVYGRLASQILTFAEEYGVPDGSGTIRIPLRLTQDELAALVGASRVRVNQALAFYKRHRCISVDRQLHITVHDPAALARRCR